MIVARKIPSVFSSYFLRPCRKQQQHLSSRLVSHELNGLSPGFQSQPTETKDLSLNLHASSAPDTKMLRGTILDHSVDLLRARPGDKLDIPYQITVSESLQTFWHSAFFDNNRIHTSQPFCRQMGLQDRVVPFSLALFLASAMTHEDAAKVQVGFGKVSYIWPIFAGDTMSQAFTVTKMRNTSDGHHSIINFTCDLINQRGRLCMRADKALLFQFPLPESELSARVVEEEPVNRQLFRDHLLSKATTVLAENPSFSLADLKPGILILHTMHRSLTFSQSQQLASLARLTHERHFDSRKYDRTNEIFVPGGLVLGITMSATARDLHEILHEEIQSCAYVNNLHPENVVGAMSYVQDVDDNLPGDLEVASVVTLGFKSINARELAHVDIPAELFRPGIFAKEIENICKKSCPILSGKIVVAVERKILRQTRHRQVFLL
mmetsp:Transcript_20847/g.26931  ORF Transcript_20847/g.26931 Transcript_20847/m.26931 type:complete len:436 (+) Transcript_20847:73-1380(+)